MLCRRLYTNDVYWHAITSPRQLISSSVNSHIFDGSDIKHYYYSSAIGSLDLFFLGAISYPRRFWNVVACVLFSPFVHVRRRFFSSFTLAHRPLCRLLSSPRSSIIGRGGAVEKKTKRAENHHGRRLERYRRRDVVPDRNKGVSVTLTNSQIDRRREPI